MASEVVTATEDPVFAREEPMRLRVESGPLPLDVRVTADDGREVEVTSIKWECDTGNPMPRATIEMECFGALLDVERHTAPPAERAAAVPGPLVRGSRRLLVPEVAGAGEDDRHPASLGSRQHIHR